MSLISRQAAIDEIMGQPSEVHYPSWYAEQIKALPPAQLEITDEQAIDRLQESGWMQNHDRQMYEMGLKERLADDSGSYDALLPSVKPKQDREFIKLTVRNSNGRPYYSIIYLEVDDNGVGHDLEGYSSYSLDVISDYLKKYFMLSTQPDVEEKLYQYKCFITDNEGLQHEVIHIGDIRRATGWEI